MAKCLKPCPRRAVIFITSLSWSMVFSCTLACTEGEEKNIYKLLKQFEYSWVTVASPRVQRN